VPSSPRVESVNPTCLADLDAMFRRVGHLLGADEAARALIARFAATAAEIARRHQGRPVRRALVLEWFDPPFSSGHWNPEIVALAGGVEVIGEPGQRSRRLSWDEVAAADPEVILLSPCGFTIGRTEQELPELQARPEWNRLTAVRDGGVTLVDGSAYFSRPGPRLEASLRIAAAAIDPEACGDLAPPEGWRRLPARCFQSPSGASGKP
jgi:iron complex transport system substrate-binding protein